LPLTPNGKVDRKALPDPDEAAYAHREYEAPIGETEQTLATIWQDLLHVERVGRHDNFFELGGHSLLTVQMGSRIRQSLEIEMPLLVLFRTPVLAELADAALDAQLAQFDVKDVERATIEMAALAMKEEREMRLEE